MKARSIHLRKTPSPLSEPVRRRGLRWRVPRRFAATALAFALGILPLLPARAQTNLAALVLKKTEVSKSRVEGSIQQLSAEDVHLHGPESATLTGDLLLTGSPTVEVKGSASHAGVIPGTGSATPSNYKVTLDHAFSLRYIRTRIDPEPWFTVPDPPPATGTRTVTLDSPADNPGDFATIKVLEVKGTRGFVAVPPGTYERIKVDGTNGLILGVAGATAPTIYNLKKLEPGRNTQVRVAGPIILTLHDSLHIEGVMGATNQSSWLDLRLADGDVNVEHGGVLHAIVSTPKKRVHLHDALLVGAVRCAELAVHDGAVLRWGAATNAPPAVDAGADQSITLPATATLAGSVNDDGLPSGSMLASFWARMSGAGDVTFADSNAPATTASFSLPGTYILRLTTSDSEMTAHDEVMVVVNRAHEPPIAFAQALSANEDHPLPIHLQGADPDGDALTFTVVTNPVSGVLSGTGSNLVYTPNPDFHGEDRLMFTVSDGLLASAPAQVSITIEPVNDAPLAYSQSVTNLEDTPGLIQLTALDAEATPLTYILLRAPAHGMLEAAPGPLTTNALSYTPALNYHGPDEFTFKVSDGTNESAPATVSIRVISVNDVPVVQAGGDRFISLPVDTVELAGAVTDDYFDGVLLNVGWTKVSGPGAVTFADAAATNTTATFSAAGVYVLRLTADDLFSLAEDELTVTVNAPPVVSAGPNQTNTLPAILNLSGTVTDDGLPTNGMLTVTWSKASGPGTVLFADPNNTNTAVTFSQSGEYLLRLTCSDSAAAGTSDVHVVVNRAPIVDAGSDQLLTNLQATLSGTVADDALPPGVAAAALWNKISGPGEAVFASPSSPATSVTFSTNGVFVLRLSADDSLAQSSDEVTLTINAGPVVDAGAEQTVLLSDTIVLNGVVTDDGVPAGVPLTTLWTLVSGPGTVTVQDASLPTTTATFSGPGIYVLRLTAHDSLASGSDEVTITVQAPNQAPTVFAGQGQLVLWPATVTLNGMATDDGLPTGGAQTVAWSQVTGPGITTFADAAAPGTTAAFSAPGNYVLRLTASDGELTAFSQVTVAVRTPAMNELPVVSAGPDRTIGLTNVLVLSGVVTDDGLPQGNAVVVQWTMVSGPGTASFANTAMTNTSVSFSALGTYVLRLTGTDSSLSSSDDVAVTVYPFNQPPVVDAGQDQVIVVPDPALLSPVGGHPTNGHVELSRGLLSTPRWNNAIGLPGLSGRVGGNSMAVGGTNLYVSGYFKEAGGVLVKGLARWDGTQWFSLYDPRPSIPTNPASPPIGLVADLTESVGVFAVRGDEVFASGGFLDNLGSDQHSDLTARWNGSNWIKWEFHNLDSTVSIRDIAASSNLVVIGGDFLAQPTNAFPGQGPFPGLPTSDNIIAWDGTNWLALGSGLPGTVMSVALGIRGEIYASGHFELPTAAGVATNIAVWNGTNWAPLGAGVSGCVRFACRAEIYALHVDERGVLYAGGDFTAAGHHSAGFIARWDGTNWSTLGSGSLNGVNGIVGGIATHGRDVYVTGQFTSAGGFTASGVARWNGQFWSPLGNGSSNGLASGNGASVAVSPQGVYVGGDFLGAGSMPANRIAFWEFPAPVLRGADLSGTITDDGLPMNSTLTLQWTKVSGPGQVTFTAATNAATAATFSALGTYVLRLTASDSDLIGSDEVTIEVRGNLPPIVSAGPDQVVEANQPVPLAGAVSDDGFPEGAGVAWQWSVAGAADVGAVVFDNRGASNCTVRFTAAGTYVLRLTANDSQFSSSDDVLITIVGNNFPPNAVARTFPETVAVGQLSTLTAHDLRDDGLPRGVTNILWSQVFGPAPILFFSATSRVCQAMLTMPGAYRVRVDVSDGELTSSSEYHLNGVAGTPPPPDGNQPPVVHAGADFGTVTFQAIPLSGSVADDGLPNGGEIHSSWYQVSGPANVYFSDALGPDTTARFYLTGTYVLRLVGSDGSMSAFDEVTVTVGAPTNEAPFVVAGPDVVVTRPASALLEAWFFDDALPLGYSKTYSWSVVSGPGAVAITPVSGNISNDYIAAAATFSAAGDYVLRVTASDSQFSDFDDLTVTVHEGTNAPPSVDAGADFLAVLSVPAVLHTQVADDGLLGGLLEVSWSQVSGPGAAYFSTVNGGYRASFSAPGTYVLRLTASDYALAASDDVQVTVADASDPPVVIIASPFDTATVTAPTVITGTVQSAILQSWTLQYRLKPDGTGDSEFPLPGGEGQGEGEPWITLATASTEAAGPLASFDPTLLLNGPYELQLSATDQIGRSSSTNITIVVDRNLKVGNFTVSFSDLTIPVAGIPIQITRTYDSRNKSAGDFGTGWSLDLLNIRLQKNRHPGRAWDQSVSGGLLPSYCIDTERPRLVTITFPDGRVQKFQGVPVNLNTGSSCQGLIPLIYPTMLFVPADARTRGTLTPLFEFAGQTVVDDQLVFGAFEGIPGRGDLISFERLLNPPPGPADNILFNPDLFEFTTEEGYRYLLSETNGLRRVTDPNGNTLAITTNGILHSSGKSVVFHRDGLGRITNIVDAAGHGMHYAYDTNGNLATFIDRDGNTNRFTYDGRHGLLTMSDARGVQTTANTYDAEGRLVASANASGQSAGYFHDVAGRRQFITNRLGFVTIHDSDQHGNVIRITHADGVVSGFTYDADGNLLSKTNVNGCACSVTYTYDAGGRILTETDHRGNTTRYTYNSLGKVLTLTEPSGFSTTNVYDGNGNLLSTVDGTGQRTAFTYNAQGKVTTLTDPRGNVSRFAYNADGMLTNEVNALGHVTEYTVDANGNMLSQAVRWSQVSAMLLAQAESRKKGWMEAGLVPTPVTVTVGTNVVRLVMRHEYLPSGQPLRVLYYAGGSSEFSYKDGRKDCVTDQDGRQTCYTYNAEGKIECITHPNGCRECFDYDAEGQLISTTDKRGFTTRFFYDVRGKLIRTLFADGSEISATYYADGSLYSETAKNGEVTTYEIDGDGNRTAVHNSAGTTRYEYNYKRFATAMIDPLNRTNRYGYDALGRSTEIAYPDASRKLAAFSGKLLVSETNQNGHGTGYEYDALGRLIAVTNALGRVTRYTYDELGNRISETDALGRATFYEYDAMRRRTRTVFPDLTETFTIYDAAGRAIVQTDQAGNSTRFVYDAADNVTAITNSLGHVTQFAYDCGGNKLSETTPDGHTTRYEYDQLSRRTRVLHHCGTSEGTTYDIAGQVVSQTDLNGRTTSFGYDLRGNLLAVTNVEGRTMFYTYDAMRNRLTETDPDGRVTRHEYDALDRRIRTTYPDSTTQQFAYDGVGRLITQTDQNGKTTIFTYDALGQLTAVTDAQNHTTRFGYDATGNRIAQTNAQGHVTRHEYDAMNRLTRTVLPDGSSTTLAYDAVGRLASQTDAKGKTTFYGYDDLGRLTSRMDPLLNVTRTAYDNMGRVIARTDATNQTTGFGYDCFGRRNRITYPDGTSRFTEYDNKGRRIRETDPNGHSTFFGYDFLDRLTSVTNALGHVTRMTYDALGRMTNRTDALGRSTAYEYDALGRRTRTTYADGATQATAYDAKGRPIRETDARGNPTLFAYDELDRLIAVTNALGNVTRYEYDELGQLTAQTDANGHRTQFEHDSVGRLTRTLYADGTERLATYDLLGRRIADIDPAGQASGYAYDEIGRLIAVTNAAGQVTQFDYDAVDRLVAQIDANHHTNSFEYDSLGRRIRRTLAGGQTESYAYDAAGNLIARTNFNGRATTYAYDALNRVNTRTPDAQFLAAGAVPITFAYDAVGQRTNMVDASGSTSYRHDVRSRLVEKTKTWLGIATAATLLYGHDLNGNVTTIESSQPNGAAIAYEYDAVNRLGAVVDPRLGRTACAYDPAGNLTSCALPNGLTNRYDYSALNRLTNLATANASGAIVSQFTYALGPAGHRLQAVEKLIRDTVTPQLSTLTRTFGYDATYRLTNEAIAATGLAGNLPASANAAYTYDAVGNRLSRTSTGFAPATLPSATHTYDAGDRLLGDGYDPNGNTTNSWVRDPLSVLTNHVADRYDFEDRLVERHATTQGGQTSTITITYDGDGNRVQKSVASVTGTNSTFFVVDDQNPTGYAQVMEELAPLNTDPVQLAVTRVYAWGRALVSQDQLLNTGTNLAWTASFHGADGHGSIRYLSDSAGNITDTFDYDAFGNLVARTGTTPNLYHFAGEQFDPDLGLYYLRARYADADRGRFWTADTFEGFATEPASLHKYTFNHNDPVNRIDPSGHYSTTEMLGVSYLAPIVRGAVLSLFEGVNNFSHGQAGGEPLKFTTRTEAYFIDSLAPGPGWQFGKPNFWATVRGAPFLLAHNPNIWQGKKPCWYECVPFDMYAPVYGPGAKFPMFEMESNELYEELVVFADVAHGSMVGAMLRAKAQEWAEAADDPNSHWLVNGARGTIGSLYGVGAAAVSPQSYVDTYNHINERTYTVMMREFDSGASGTWAFASGLSTAAGEVLAYNRALEAGYGVDAVTQEQFSTSERWTKGFEALSQGAAMVAGGLKGFNPAARSFRLGSGHLASEAPGALVKPAPDMCAKPRPAASAMRERVEAAIAESKAARAASKFDEFEARAKAANQLEIEANRDVAALNIRRARQILKETRDDLSIVERNQIIRGFDLETFRVNTLQTEVLDFRYFDGVNAQLGGRWSTTQWIEAPSDRIRILSLPNNDATRAATVRLQPGTVVFEGKVAPQLSYGENLTGGGFQRYNAAGPRATIDEIR